MKLLIAVDGSKYSEEAVRAVSCFPFGSQILFVHAMDPARAYPAVGIDLPAMFISSNEENVRKQGEEILARADQAVSSLGFKATKRLESGVPADVILSVAEAEEVDLIVMGARGLGMVEELAFGSVSHQVLAHAPCPVLVVRDSIFRIGCAVVPVETGHDVQLLLGFLSRRLFRELPELAIVTVLPTYRGLYNDAERSKAATQRANEAVDELVRRVRALGFHATGEVLWGAPEEAIPQEAERRHADLIVIGSRGRSALSRFFLGSAGHSILHRARCPVLVVRGKVGSSKKNGPAAPARSEAGVSS